MHKTYKETLTKDDKLMLQAAKRILGSKYSRYWKLAVSEFQRESTPSAGKRKANMLFVDAMKRYGVTNWRQYLEMN